MGVKVNLPPGCAGLDLKDGSRYNARRAPGGGRMVEVSERHARAINSGQFGEQGLMDAHERSQIGTKKGRWCKPCGRIWQAWTTTCHKCGGETVPEE